MKGVNIFLADGFEDVEAIGTNDVLRRGGVNVQLVAIGEDPFVVSSHGITVSVDQCLDFMDLSADGTTAQDVMIFPGGMPGSKNLAGCKKLIQAAKAHYAAGGTVAAICAAPGLVLGQLDCWEGTQFTCFDGFESGPIAKGGEFVKEPSVVSGRVITGRSAGYATPFGLDILSVVKGDEAVEKVFDAMLLEVE